MRKRGNSGGEDNFRVQPGAPKQRGQTFVSQVLRQTTKAANATGGKRGKGGKAPGSRLGRGHVAARFTGQSLSASSRRATVKVRLVYLKTAGARSTITHLRYIEREGVGRAGRRQGLWAADRRGGCGGVRGARSGRPAPVPPDRLARGCRTAR